MAAIIKGITVILHDKVQTGTDAANRPVYEDVPVRVENVLVTPTTEAVGQTIIVDAQDLTGRKVGYTLAIPKGDTHNWTDRKVEFFGQMFRTVGMPTRGIDDLIPLDWNMKVRCELVNGE